MVRVPPLDKVTELTTIVAPDTVTAPPLAVVKPGVPEVVDGVLQVAGTATSTSPLDKGPPEAV